MKIVLGFGSVELIKGLSNEDCIVYNKSIEYEGPAKMINVNSAKIDFAGITKEYELNCEQFFQGNPLLKDVYASGMNNLYTNHLYVHKWKWIIDERLKTNEVSEIIFTDLVPTNNYAPYYEAEGEIHKELFYKRYDFVPVILMEYIKEKHPHIKLKILRKHRTFGLLLRKFARRYLLLFFKLAFYLFKSVLKQKQAPILIDGKEPYVLMCTRSVAHFDAFRLLHRIQKNSIVFCGESVFTFGNNFKYTQKTSDKNIISFLNYFDFKDVWKGFLEVLGGIKENRSTLKWKCNDLVFPLGDSMKEMLIAYFDVIVYQKALENFVSRELPKTTSQSSIFTGEMYTPFAYVAMQVAKQNNLIGAQVQTTNMFIIEEPNYIFGDYFFFSSRSLAEGYRSKQLTNADKARFIGNVLNKKPSAFIPKKEYKNVVYFTQPITDEDIEQDIIGKLIDCSTQYGFKVYVKLHPRDKRDKLETFKDSIEIIDGSVSTEEYYKLMDIAVLKTSSIAAQIVLSGIPIIYCLFSDWARNGKLDYLDFNYSGTLQELSAFDKLFEKGLENLESDFVQYRNRYIQENSLDQGVDEFVISYKELIGARGK